MNLDLYVITDETLAGGRSHEEIARHAIAGGADVVQLRDKRCGCRDLVRTGKAIAMLAGTSGTLFIVNDRLDVALACGADGIHLGQGDLCPGTARQLSPPGFIIGVSVGSASEAKAAEQDGADYVALSPVFDTGSKNNAGPGHGLETLIAIRDRVSIPVIAIGGINRSNVADIIAAGADGVAVLSAVVSAPDIAGAARELKELVIKCKSGSRRRPHRMRNGTAPLREDYSPNP